MINNSSLRGGQVRSSTVDADSMEGRRNVAIHGCRHPCCRRPCICPQTSKREDLSGGQGRDEILCCRPRPAWELPDATDTILVCPGFTNFRLIPFYVRSAPIGRPSTAPMS